MGSIKMWDGWDGPAKVDCPCSTDGKGNWMQPAAQGCLKCFGTGLVLSEDGELLYQLFKKRLAHEAKEGESE